MKTAHTSAAAAALRSIEAAPVAVLSPESMRGAGFHTPAAGRAGCPAEATQPGTGARPLPPLPVAGLSFSAAPSPWHHVWRCLLLLVGIAALALACAGCQTAQPPDAIDQAIEKSCLQALTEGDPK